METKSKLQPNHLNNPMKKKSKVKYKTSHIHSMQLENKWNCMEL